MLKYVVAEHALDQPPAHWAAHWGPPRPHANFGTATEETGRGLPRPVSMEPQLSQLQRRSRDVLGHKLIRHPAMPALRRLGQMLLANIHRIQDIGRSAIVADGPHDSTVPLIQETIQSSHRLLDTIVAQIALCDSTTRETLAVAAWGRRLVAQEPLKFYKLLPLFDRICDEIRRVRELRMLIPLPGLALASLVESQTGEIDAANFVGGVTTARVLVWLLGDDQRQTRSLARLVLAALLQDVGRLPISGGLSGHTLRGQRTDWLEQQHPTIGAALFGSIRGAPVELPMLVAQHHEQLDGGGFPRALAARDILPESAILATAGRFAELCLIPPGAPLPGEISPAETFPSTVGKSAPARAAEALLSEAEWGKWPLDFSKLLAQRVAEAETLEHWQLLEGLGEVSTAEIDLPGPSAANSTAGDRRLQWHDHEKNLQGMHTDPSPEYSRLCSGIRENS